MDAVTAVPAPVNEPVLTYAPGSPEREELSVRLAAMTAESPELPMTIGGASRMGGGPRIEVVQPHQHKAVLGTLAEATETGNGAAVRAVAVPDPGLASWGPSSTGARSTGAAA